eukprot:scaffold3.g6442.t1
MRERLKIDVWSDLACPWCYVGKKRLDKAIAALGLEGDSAVQVNWHSYIIDTRTNKEGEDYLAYNERRWGGDGWTADLRRSGGPDGAAFADWRWWPSTLQAHRLVALASKHGKGSAAKELLFQKTYEQGQNISQLDTLIAAGQELGLPDVEAYLRSDAGRDEVLADDVLGKQRRAQLGSRLLLVLRTLSRAASGRPSGGAAASRKARDWRTPTPVALRLLVHPFAAREAQVPPPARCMLDAATSPSALAAPNAQPPCAADDQLATPIQWEQQQQQQQLSSQQAAVAPAPAQHSGAPWDLPPGQEQQQRMGMLLVPQGALALVPAPAQQQQLELQQHAIGAHHQGGLLVPAGTSKPLLWPLVQHLALVQVPPAHPALVAQHPFAALQAVTLAQLPGATIQSAGQHPGGVPAFLLSAPCQPVQHAQAEQAPLPLPAMCQQPQQQPSAQVQQQQQPQWQAAAAVDPDLAAEAAAVAAAALVRHERELREERAREQQARHTRQEQQREQPARREQGQALAGDVAWEVPRKTPREPPAPPSRHQLPELPSLSELSQLSELASDLPELSELLGLGPAEEQLAPADQAAAGGRDAAPSLTSLDSLDSRELEALLGGGMDWEGAESGATGGAAAGGRGGGERSPSDDGATSGPSSGPALRAEGPPAVPAVQGPGSKKKKKWERFGPQEQAAFLDVIRAHGRDWAALRRALPGRRGGRGRGLCAPPCVASVAGTQAQIRNFWNNHNRQQQFADIARTGGHPLAVGCKRKAPAKPGGCAG